MATLAEKARRQWLVETFPKTFFEKGSERPLKRGILEDLQRHLREHPQPDVFPVEDRSIRFTLLRYVRRLTYYQQVLKLGAGTPRLDLEGSEGEPVTAAQIEWTASRLKRAERRNQAKLASKEKHLAAAAARQARKNRRHQDESSRSRPPSAEQSSATN